jgi:hypothetical protein
MTSILLRRLPFALAFALTGQMAVAASFVYEGRLDDFGQAANGRYDLKLSAFGHPAQGSTLAPATTFDSVEVRDGRFRLDVDLPLVNTDDVWLELAVRQSGGAAFSALPGRSKAIAAPLIGACWSTTGDTGSNSAVNFLGTTDAEPLIFRTANARSLRIEPSSLTFGSPALPITTNTIAGSHANGANIFVRGATVAGGGMPTGNSDPGSSSDGPNLVTDNYGTVSGGYANQAGEAASVLGGAANVASGPASVVSGGFRNCAGGAYSWAGGNRAKVRPSTDPGGSESCSGLTYPGGNGDIGTFVWADGQNSNFVSTGNNQFLVRAAGGFGLNTAPPTNGIVEITVESSSNGGDVANLWLKQRGVQDGILFNVASGSGSNNAGLFIDHYDGSNQARRMELAANGSVLIRSNVTGANSGVSMAAGGGSFTSLSDRRVKTAIEAIDAAGILARVVDLPISTWSYIAQGAGVRHIGPMAQDFKAAFAVGESDTGITTIDADGVALAAIQGLNAKLEAERNALVGQVGRLDAENVELKARLDRLEAHLGTGGAQAR